MSSPGSSLELGQKGEREGGGRTAPQEEQVLLPLEMLALHLGHEEWLWLTGGMAKRYGLLVVFLVAFCFRGWTLREVWKCRGGGSLGLGGKGGEGCISVSGEVAGAALVLGSGVCGVRVWI